MGRPTVTALRHRGSVLVAVELDGRPWRVLPADVLQATGLAIGVELDRTRARAVGRALRQVTAMHHALGMLERRDRPARNVDAALERRGVRERERRDAVERLERVGIVSDARYAKSRARALSARGFGNRFIEHDLERSGVGPQLIAEALAALEPESGRAERISASRGITPKLVRLLAARGFSEDVLETLVAALPEGEIS